MSKYFVINETISANAMPLLYLNTRLRYFSKSSTTFAYLCNMAIDLDSNELAGRSIHFEDMLSKPFTKMSFLYTNFILISKFSCGFNLFVRFFSFSYRR